jgi:hypothetical protein
LYIAGVKDPSNRVTEYRVSLSLACEDRRTALLGCWSARADGAGADDR